MMATTTTTTIILVMGHLFIANAREQRRTVFECTGVALRLKLKGARRAIVRRGERPCGERSTITAGQIPSVRYAT